MRRSDIRAAPEGECSPGTTAPPGALASEMRSR
jgi:hypothetical protein